MVSILQELGDATMYSLEVKHLSKDYHHHRDFASNKTHLHY